MLEIQTDRARSGETSPNHAVTKVLGFSIALALLVMFATIIVL